MDYTTDRTSPVDSLDDSFEADRYTHVDRKLPQKLPKCLSKDSKCKFTNYFVTKKTNSNDGNKSKVIRRRLSAYQIKAGILNQNNTNCNNNTHNTSSSRAVDKQDRSSSKYVLQAKVQHLLFEMKKIRQKDRELLKQFYTINDTIEELQWMYKEKEESLEKDLLGNDEEDVIESESDDDPYEKDMEALEDADVDVEVENEEDDDVVEHFKDDFRQYKDGSSEIHTDTLDSGLTKSLSSLSLTNSSPTMSYQMSSASSRSHSPTESSMTSSLTRSSAKSPMEEQWTSIPNQTYVPVESITPTKQAIAYCNDTYEDNGGLITNCAYDSLHGVDYVTRKKQLYNESASLPNHKKLHSSQTFTSHKSPPSSYMSKHDSYISSRRVSDNSLPKLPTATSRLLKHPLTQSNQIRRTTSFQENTPSLQPWKYRFVPIDENRSSDVKQSNLTYDGRRTNDRCYQNVMSFPRQSQTLDRANQQLESNIAQIKIYPSRRVSGTGSAGSLTSQSSSSDSSTSSLHSKRQREARNPADYRSNGMSRSYSVNLSETKGVIYKRPLATTNTSIYQWVRSQNDEVMYL